jgi:drug/metabolite transporter (DMT)-like permease
MARSGYSIRSGSGGAVRSSRFLPVFALAVLALIWGYSWVPSKLGIINSGPFVFAALRTLPGGLILLALLPAFGRPMRPKAVRLTLLLGLLQIGGFAGLTSAALVAGGAGHTAMLANTWQFWLLVLAWLLLGERLRGGQWLSVGLGLVGLVLIIEPWQLRGVLSGLLTLAGAVCFAGGAVIAKVLNQRHKADLLSLSAWQNIFGCVPLVIAAFVVPGQSIQWSGTFVWSLAFCTLVVTALGSILWLFVLKALPANIAGIGTIGTPVVGVLASWIQLDEHLSAPEIVGMVLVVAALGLLVLWGARGRGQGESVQKPGGAA